MVPCHALQIESGLTVSSDRKQRGYDLPEALLRFGVTKSSEVRLNVPNYFQNYGSNGSFVTGVGDLGVGVKQSLAATKKGFNLAVIGALTFPTGAYAVSSHGYDPALQIMPSQQLPDHLSVAGMFSVAWPTQGSVRNTTGQANAVLDWQVKKPTDLFFEYSGSFPGSGSPLHSIDFGALYRPTRKQQLDFRTGIGLSSAATDRVFGVGYSIHFDL